MKETYRESVRETRCERFESAWRAGKAMPIEHYLPPDDDPAQLATLEELIPKGQKKYAR